MKHNMPDAIGFWRGFSEYLKLYMQELSLEGRAMYKVVKMPISSDQPVTFQLTDKDVSLSMTIEEIINEGMLYGFSKKEMAALCLMRSQSPQDLQIDSISTGNDESSAVVSCTDASRSFQIRKSPQELIANIGLMRRFKLKDVINISYFAGREDSKDAL